MINHRIACRRKLQAFMIKILKSDLLNTTQSYIIYIHLHTFHMVTLNHRLMRSYDHHNQVEPRSHNRVQPYKAVGLNLGKAQFMASKVSCGFKYKVYRRQLSLNEYHHVMMACEQKQD